jgi:N-acetylglucosamine kinase-like BadF-type ATPase
MIIIADSGSTKTHWCSVGNGKKQELITRGLNPRIADIEIISTEIRHARKSLGKADTVYFYGAGCGNEEMQMRIKTYLLDIFLHAQCYCWSDLLGACRALCGTDEGMVGILGTGSNLCYYDGKAVARKRLSTGYLLGDEGSGNQIGRRLLKDYLEERMPQRISTMFYENYYLTNEQFLDQLYSARFPNRYLASFTTFAALHQDEDYIVSLLDECFDAYFGQLDYFGSRRLLPLNLTGGIVNSFLPAIRRAAERHAVSLGTLMPDPMMGLVRYHTAHLDHESE